MRIRQILGLAVLIALIGGAGPAVADEDAPSADEAKARLKEAYELGADDAIVEAIEYGRGLNDPDVVALIADGMRVKNAAVVEASLKALGRSPHPDALAALHKVYKRVRKKRIDGYEHLFPVLLKSIGRHGDPSSVEILSDAIWFHPSFEAFLARIMGLGNIRTPEAVEALVKMSRQAGGRGVTGVRVSWREPLRVAFRSAMATLTGQDEGLVPDDWDRWWRDHKRIIA